MTLNDRDSSRAFLDERECSEGPRGRLKCCLRYEYATYVELKRPLPNIGKRVECVKGSGKVLRQNILKQTVLIQREDDGGVVEVTLEDLVETRTPNA